MSWIASHPALFVATLWPIVSAVITSVFRKRTVAELADLPPRVAAFLKFCMAFGIDVPRTLDAIHGIIVAKLPGIDAVPPPVATTWGNAVATEVDLTSTTKPPPAYGESKE